MVKQWTLPPARDTHQPHIAVLMCTYNGAEFLQEQINSLAAQTHRNLTLWVSDDGSQDQTRSLLQSAQQVWGNERLVILDGPKKGFARNFLSLACRCDIEGDYFALCDQDDIWSPQKLQQALVFLEGATQDQACLYGSATRLIDSTGQELGDSTLSPSRLSFSNALVQNFASGNSMVFNQRLRQYVQQAGTDIDIVAHDWWLYVVVTAVGGKVTFDPNVQLFYRQHKGNIIGANNPLKAKLQRIRAMLTGRLLSWLRIHCESLSPLHESMPASNLTLLRKIETCRQLPRHQRLCKLRQIELQRQSLAETWFLKTALALAPKSSFRT